MHKFMTDKRAKEIADKFLSERCIPDVAGHSECLAKLLQEVFKDGCELIAEQVSNACFYGDKD